MQVTRRAFLGLTAGAVGGLALPAPAAAAGDGVVWWINRHATPLGDLRRLRGVVRGAEIVGLGESAHGTHTKLRLKQRVARYLVEELGFRTIAWEEGWGSGVAIDRYVTGGQGDPAAVVGDALFMLRTEAMLDLVRWMREFNRGRPDHDKVRFLGADVLELRPVQFDELRRHVADVAPDQRDELEAHLAPVDWRGDPFAQLGWYTQLEPAEQRRVIAHAGAVDGLVRATPPGSSVVSRADAVQHAHALVGFYQAHGPDGDADDIRDRYVTEIINRHGQVLTGWEVQPGGPAIYDVPPPDDSLVDYVLGQGRDPDYLIDLHQHAPPPVRCWLRDAARMRIIGSAYRPADDADYAITVDPWRGAFDALLHLDHVTPQPAAGRWPERK